MLATAFATTTETGQFSARPTAKRTAATDPLAQRLMTAPVRSFEAKEHIWQEGDKVSHVYKVEAGHVCIYKMLSDGRRQVVDFAYPGDLIGLGALDEHATSALATARTRVRCLPTPLLHQVMRDDSRLGLMVYEAMSRELAASRELLFTVSQRSAMERVAAFLIALSRRNERNGDDPLEFVLPMTRSDIADFLGLTIETVSRTMTKLRADRLIDLAQCVLVTIVDHAGLAALADGRRH